MSTILLFGQVSLKVLAKFDSLPPRFSSKNMSPINKMSKLSAKDSDTLRKIQRSVMTVLKSHYELWAGFSRYGDCHILLYITESHTQRSDLFNEVLYEC